MANVQRSDSGRASLMARLTELITRLLDVYMHHRGECFCLITGISHCCRSLSRPRPLWLVPPERPSSCKRPLQTNDTFEKGGKSNQNTQRESLSTFPSAGTVRQMSRVVHCLQKLMLRVVDQLKKPRKDGRPMFANLETFLTWLFAQTGRPQQRCSQQCMVLFSALAPESNGKCSSLSVYKPFCNVSKKA